MRTLLAIVVALTVVQGGAAAAQHSELPRYSFTVEIEGPVAQYKLVNAWPRKYEGPTLNTGTSDVPVETIEIAHAGLLRPDGTR